MIVGFTGTRYGMTEKQRFAVSEWLDEHRPSEIHVGDCKGADSEFLDAALLCNSNNPPRTHGHPCDIRKWRAFRRYDSLYPVRSPSERNQDIVNASERLLVAPKSVTPERHSGTWQTTRMMLDAFKPITIIYPDGSVQPLGDPIGIPTNEVVPY